MSLGAEVLACRVGCNILPSPRLGGLLAWSWGLGK